MKITGITSIVYRTHARVSHLINWLFFEEYFKVVREWREGVAQAPDGGMPFQVDEYLLVCQHEYWREKVAGEKYKPLSMFCDACFLVELTRRYGRKSAMKRYNVWNKLLRGRG